MKIPDFLEEHNQGAEKVFGDHAQQMSDSLLYAKLPPKWKRSVNMARLENDSYDKIVAQLKREFELNALEDSDDLPIASMTSSTPKSRTPLSTGQATDNACNYCKEKGHMVKDCKKLKKKKERTPKKANRLRRKSNPECGSCGKTKITPKNDFGEAPVRFSSINLPGLKIHWITIRTRNYKNRNITQPRLAPS